MTGTSRWAFHTEKKGKEINIDTNVTGHSDWLWRLVVQSAHQSQKNRNKERRGYRLHHSRAICWRYSMKSKDTKNWAESSRGYGIWREWRLYPILCPAPERIIWGRSVSEKGQFKRMQKTMVIEVTKLPGWRISGNIKWLLHLLVVCCTHCEQWSETE